MMTMQLLKRIEVEVVPRAPVQNQGGIHAPPIQAKAARARQHLHGHHGRQKEVGRGRLCPAAIVLFRDRRVHQDRGPGQSQSRDQFQNPGQDPVREALFPALAKLKCKRM